MKSLTFPQYGNGCHIVDKYGNEDLKGDFIKLSKIGTIPFIKHIEIGEIEDSHGNKVIIPYQIKTITVKREVDKWIFIPVISTFVEIEIPVIHNNVNTKVEYKKEIKDIKTIEDLKLLIYIQYETVRVQSDSTNWHIM